MDPKSFQPGEWVLVRQIDGLLWPAEIMEVDESAGSAEVQFINPLMAASRAGTRPLKSSVNLQLIYKLPWNLYGLMVEAEQRTFGPDAAHKPYYRKVLQEVHDTYVKRANTHDLDGEVASQCPRVIPVLRTKSPPRVMVADKVLPLGAPIPDPDDYGTATCDAIALGIKKLYYVSDLASADKVLGQFEKHKFPPDVAIVCENHPEWMFTERYNYLQHFNYAHPNEALSSESDSDDD